MSKGDDCVVKLERVLVSDAGTGISAEVKKTTVAGVDQGGEQIAIQQTEVTIKLSLRSRLPAYTCRYMHAAVACILLYTQS